MMLHSSAVGWWRRSCPGSRCAPEEAEGPCVDMGMGGQHAVDLARRNGDGLVLIDILALFHTTVDEVALSRRFQEGTAAGHFVVGTQKRQFHRHTSNGIIQL